MIRGDHSRALVAGCRVQNFAVERFGSQHGRARGCSEAVHSLPFTSALSSESIFAVEPRFLLVISRTSSPVSVACTSRLYIMQFMFLGFGIPISSVLGGVEFRGSYVEAGWSWEQIDL